MLLPSCGNENLHVFLKIRLCKNKREENKELVFLFWGSCLHLSRCTLAFGEVFCFKSPEKIIVISKPVVTVSKDFVAFYSFELTFWPFYMIIHYPFCAWETKAQKLQGRFLSAPVAMGMLCLPCCEPVGAETQFQHVPRRAPAPPARPPTPSSPE